MKEEGVPMSQDTAWLDGYDPFDPERARVREEIRQQALRDATEATEAVRATLRLNLTRGASARVQTVGTPEGQNSTNPVSETTT